MTTLWTEERVELLKKLWNERLSASRIAFEIGGISRNAVVGKAHRLGLEGRENAGGRPKKPKPGPVASIIAPGTLSPIMAAPDPGAITRWNYDPLPESNPVSIVDLKNADRNNEGQCKWPLEYRSDVIGGHLFCGAKNMGNGVNYCAVHWRKSMTEEGFRRATSTAKRRDQAA